METQPHFDTWTILFLISAIHGFVLALMLYRHGNGNIKANKILASIIILFAISMTYYVAFWTGFSGKHIWMNGWIAPISFLYGPLIYLYVLTLNDKERSPTFNLHYIPFIIHFIFMIPLLIRNIFGVVPFLRDNYFIPFNRFITPINYGFIVLQCISMVFYAILIMRYTRRERQKINEFALPQEFVKSKWLNQISWFYLIFSVVSISYWFLVATALLKLEYDYAISITISVFIYIVGYMGFKQPSIFNERILMDTPAEEIPEMGVKHIKANIKYERSTLKKEEAEILYKQLLQIMACDKPYLRNDLKIQHVAAILKISTHHLSQIINELGGQNYADFINVWRIREAERLLSDPNNNEKILSVAFDVGYNNKATFNTAFKKITGLSPSDYRKRALQKVVA